MTCRWFRREMNTDVKQFIESIVSCKLPKSIYSILLVLGDCLSQPSYSVPIDDSVWDLPNVFLIGQTTLCYRIRLGLVLGPARLDLLPHSPRRSPSPIQKIILPRWLRGKYEQITFKLSSVSS